jgi:hypothetical protein
MGFDRSDRSMRWRARSINGKLYDALMHAKEVKKKIRYWERKDQQRPVFPLVLCT